MTSPAQTEACQAARLSVAPMMDWTDRHCRSFHRLMSRRALLYTEMVTSAALIRGDARHLLEFNAAEHPVALQLGGSDPAELAQAAKLGEGEGYDEINLNCGCPSDRVQSGSFGAVLMESPALVAEACAEMIAATKLPVTVKCRIGVDDQVPEEILPNFLIQIAEAGVQRVTIHARKAWLQGLSPKENRDIPPLDYPLVHAMKSAFPKMHISINGGVTTLEEAEGHLTQGLDGVMIGRAAYHDPASVLMRADSRIFGAEDPMTTPAEVVEAMKPYIANHLAAGGRLHQITRHMLGLFTGQPGARAWRRILSTEGTGPNAGLEALDAALAPLRAA
ncbi:tRNA dihydrouridine(20/20a) synthase DusA [Alphaproteobacteria bacterium KMM 3653]|uniref:tRNA-dihydrouridine(20/20a) synthase n=1 Tax=Harenicola maris TaxID=2841044 RepID=A0AAP2G3U7_9RHOB|nr:tRNA dihydrouridine(20/20a) synthase DusA [Harenicola maris]